MAAQVPRALGQPCFFVPVRLLSPKLLVSNYIHNLAISAGIPGALFISLAQDITAPFDPDGIAEALCKLEQHRLAVGQLAGVQVVSLGLDDADDRLTGIEGGWGC